jgi:hypothetical protein
MHIYFTGIGRSVYTSNKHINRAYYSMTTFVQKMRINHR